MEKMEFWVGEDGEDSLDVEDPSTSPLRVFFLNSKTFNLTIKNSASISTVD